VEIAVFRSGGRGKSKASQLFEAPLSLGQLLVVIFLKKMSAVACVVHHDLGSHGENSAMPSL
jgi:membrane-associated PAP2 superfamily phosphatase